MMMIETEPGTLEPSEEKREKKNPGVIAMRKCVRPEAF